MVHAPFSAQQDFSPLTVFSQRFPRAGHVPKGGAQKKRARAFLSRISDGAAPLAASLW
jgi:hypothetical protein